jgi:hypothetical protein
VWQFSFFNRKYIFTISHCNLNNPQAFLEALARFFLSSQMQSSNSAILSSIILGHELPTKY